jgi:hypothetical protein
MSNVNRRRPLRILHVANFGYKAKAVTLHSVAWKLTNGWTRSGHHVITYSDRDIARWAGLFGHRKWGIIPANRTLVEVATNMEPDVLAFGHADTIRAETIAEIRQKLPKARVLQWNIDPLFEGQEASSDDNRRRIFSKIDVVDATFVTTPGEPLAPIAARCKITGFIPNPSDPAIERLRADENPAPAHDLFFAAGWGDHTRFHAGQNRHVDTFCRDMTAALPHVKFKFAGVLEQPLLFGPAYDRVLAECAMGLNMSRRNDVYLYSSERIAHYAANGLVTFIDRANGYQDFFAEDELAFYSTEAELFEKIAKLSKDHTERRRIGARGRARYHELFDSEIVGDYMLDALFGEHDPTRYKWPTLYQPGIAGIPAGA